MFVGSPEGEAGSKKKGFPATNGRLELKTLKADRVVRILIRLVSSSIEIVSPSPGEKRQLSGRAPIPGEANEPVETGYASALAGADKLPISEDDAKEGENSGTA